MYIDAAMSFAGGVNAANNIVGQAVTSLGNTVSTNVYDTAPLALGGNQVGDNGAGAGQTITIRVLQTLTSGGAATVQFQLVDASDSAISSNVRVLNQTDVFAFTTLTAGTDIGLRWPPAPNGVPQRYVAVRFVVAGAALTGGTFWAFVAADRQDMGQGGRGVIGKALWTIA